VPNTTGSADGLVAVLNDHLREPAKIDGSSGVDVLLPIFRRWYESEVAGLGESNDVLDKNAFGGAVIKHVGYGRMRASWDSRCSCGHKRSFRVRRHMLDFRRITVSLYGWMVERHATVYNLVYKSIVGIYIHKYIDISYVTMHASMIMVGDVVGDFGGIM